LRNENYETDRPLHAARRWRELKAKTQPKPTPHAGKRMQRIEN
jgi:hypothetical protein